MQRREYVAKIAELEDLRLRLYILVEEQMARALSEGRSTDPSLVDSSSMKERHLEALDAHGRFGLTPQELHEKRTVWLWRPGERMPTIRVKTISMFLNRLCRDNLVSRKREGRTFRYFIDENGRSRLKHYRDLREKETELSLHDRWLYDIALSNSRFIGRIKEEHKLFEKSLSSLDPRFVPIYSYIWRRIDSLLDSIFFFRKVLNRSLSLLRTSFCP